LGKEPSFILPLTRLPRTNWKTNGLYSPISPSLSYELENKRTLFSHQSISLEPIGKQTGFPPIRSSRLPLQSSSNKSCTLGQWRLLPVN